MSIKGLHIKEYNKDSILLHIYNMVSYNKIVFTKIIRLTI